MSIYGIGIISLPHSLKNKSSSLLQKKLHKNTSNGKVTKGYIHIFKIENALGLWIKEWFIKQNTKRKNHKGKIDYI